MSGMLGRLFCNDYVDFLTGMKTEDRNSANTPKARIAVLGMVNVGKSGELNNM